jgi:alanyl-tRNA synthetase
MGFERVVSVIQDVSSNYKTDLFLPIIHRIQDITGANDVDRDNNLTPYRVIADHARATAFLIADGVVPGNIGRNYICRMLIRRAARFGMKLNLHEPFMAKIAAVVIDKYGDFYPELKRNSDSILDNLTREEKQFQKTVSAGLDHLDDTLRNLKAEGNSVLDGQIAFDLYATQGLPLEITKDIAQEQNLDVDTQGFQEAMEDHRLASGAGKEFGQMGGDDVEVFSSIANDLKQKGKLAPTGVEYSPYQPIREPLEVLALVIDGKPAKKAKTGDKVSIIIPKTWFYIEAGGQVSDTGIIENADGARWVVRVDDMQKPAAGVIVHVGEVLQGEPQTGDMAFLKVDEERRTQIMRNHTATHLLHAALHEVLGGHAQQAGSLVAPNRLRFDFNHPQPMTKAELLEVEAKVNQAILQNYQLSISQKDLQEAINEGAMALFGEKYDSVVRTIRIGEQEKLSYELCGGTHVDQTGDIGLFLITYEGSIAAGVRRIEAVTGWQAYQIARDKMNLLNEINQYLGTSQAEALSKVKNLSESLTAAQKEIEKLRTKQVSSVFDEILSNPETIKGISVLKTTLPDADMDALLEMADKFRNKYDSGVIVLGSVQENKPLLLAAITDDLVVRGLHAGKLIKQVAEVIGGGGGGRPNLAQAGGKDPSKLSEALDQVAVYIGNNLNS